MSRETRIQYLESKLPKGIDIGGELKATDTRELFLLGVLQAENITFKQE